MTTDRALCPPVAVTARLGDRARPASGRTPTRRYVFAACTLDAVDTARADLTALLERNVGPLRCTEAEVTVAVGADHADELLAQLHTAGGQSAATLNPVVRALAHVAAAAERLGLDGPCLVVASCDALTAQAHTSVWAC